MKSKSGIQRIIFFDGYCNLCNASVNFIIRHDKACIFKFALLQSDAVTGFLRNFESVKNLSVLPDSLVLVEDDKIYFRSEAALRIAKMLPGIWKMLIIFQIIPLSWRDSIYDFVAKNRHKWFGERQSCMVPTPEISKRFLWPDDVN
jgi:predicted DCC family thiol-disulfide oxidoreductase YuxK